MAVWHPPWDNDVVQGVANVLGDTATDLTGTEVGKLLTDLGIPDPRPEITKRIRLGDALLAEQMAGRTSNCVIAFITRAMAPVRYRTIRARARSGAARMDRGEAWLDGDLASVALDESFGARVMITLIMVG